MTGERLIYAAVTLLGIVTIGGHLLATFGISAETQKEAPPPANRRRGEKRRGR